MLGNNVSFVYRRGFGSGSFGSNLVFEAYQRFSLGSGLSLTLTHDQDASVYVPLVLGRLVDINLLPVVTRSDGTGNDSWRPAYAGTLRVESNKVTCVRSGFNILLNQLPRDSDYPIYVHFGYVYRLSDLPDGKTLIDPIMSYNPSYAIDIGYDNSASGLIATNVQAAIDELKDAAIATVQLDTTTASKRVVSLNSSNKAITVSYNDVGINSEKIRGLTLQSGVANDYVKILDFGVVSDPSWTFTPSQNIFLGLNGNLSQSVITSGELVRLGYAISSQMVLFHIGRSTKRG